MFVQIEELGQKGFKVICWSTLFRYEKKGSIASIRKAVVRNGKKSDSSAYAKAVEKDKPKVLKTGVGFNRLSFASYPHDAAAIQKELEDFPVNNAKEMRKEIHRKTSQGFGLRENERLGIDSLGVFLNILKARPGAYRKLEGAITTISDNDPTVIFEGQNVFHLRDSIVSHETLHEARCGIDARINIDKRRVKEVDLTTIWVTRKDSLKAGNCIPGTDAFIESIGADRFRLTKIRADALLALRDDKFTRRIIKLLTTRRGKILR